MLPLAKRLKRKAQLEIATLQDIVVEIVYKIDLNAVLHGGTAIWRCYAGTRFSEDLDFYLTAQKFEEKFEKECKRCGIEIKKLKKTANLIFAKVELSSTVVSLEGNFSVRKKGIIANYERVDGTKMPVYTLAPEELIREKMQAYLSRRLIRDLYDIYFLLTSGIANPSLIKNELKEFLQKLPEPKDEHVLKTLIYSGAVPSFKSMRDYLRRFSR